MNRVRVVVLAGTCIVASTSLLAQTAPRGLATDLEQKLRDKVLSLRVPSASNKLRFDKDGAPVGKHEHGVASLDRDILVKSIKVTDSLVKIEGQRVYYSWDAPSNELMGNLQPTKVTVEIDHAKGDISEAIVAPIFTKVFLSDRELQERACTPAETQASHQFLTDWLYKVSVVPAPAVTSKAELHSICFPTGERGYIVSKGVNAPKAVSAPDPTYSESARRRRIQGTAVYAAVVDEQGLVSDVLLVRSLDPNLNYNGAVAIRSWRFQPATFQGKPIPGAIHVEVNFRLY